MSDPNLKELRRGELVRAVEIPAWVCLVPNGMLGVVFEEFDAYRDRGGPMVMWLNGCACNVYEGWVEKLDRATMQEHLRVFICQFS